MDYPLKREKIAEGVHFSSIRNAKFKQNRISVNIILPLEREKVTNRAIVPFILRQGFEGCPNFIELNKKLGNLYGASLEPFVDGFAGHQIIGMAIVGIDSRFSLEKEDIVIQCAELLSDVILKPNIKNGEFTQQDTELQKEYLIDTIDSEINDKRTYSLIRCKDILFEGEAAAIKKYGYRAEVPEITPKTAAIAYNEILTTGQIEILFGGSGDPEPAKELFAGRFGEIFDPACSIIGQQRAPGKVNPYEKKKQEGPLKDTVETMDVSQGKLVMGFRLEDCDTYKQMNAARVAVALLGGTPCSLLFKNVREKYSLCYYCAARYDRNIGVILIDSGVEPDNMQRAREEILLQIEAMKKGEFENQELLETKLILTTALKSTTDSLSSMGSWYLTQILGNTEVSPLQEIELCSQVTKQDIIDIMNNVKLDTVYTLLPKAK